MCPTVRREVTHKQLLLLRPQSPERWFFFHLVQKFCTQDKNRTVFISAFIFSENFWNSLWRRYGLQTVFSEGLKMNLFMQKFVLSIILILFTYFYLFKWCVRLLYIYCTCVLCVCVLSVFKHWLLLFLYKEKVPLIMTRAF